MTVFSLFKEQVLKNPKAVAVSFNSTNLTYSKLYDESEKISALLQLNGVKIGDIVGICLNRSAEMISTLLGIVKAGAAYLPLDPMFPDKRLEYMLNDSGTNFLLTESSFFQKFNQFRGKFIDISEVRQIKNLNQTDDLSRPDSLAYIIYTSGSTGNPKGVQILHSSLTNFLLSMQKTPGLSSEDNVLALTTLSFDISGLEIFLPFVTGARITIASRDEAKDGKELLEKIRKEKVSTVQATPSTWKMLLDSGWNDKLNIKALCGGEALSKELADKILDRVDELWNMYGPTETTIWSSCAKVTKEDTIHIGKPIANTQFYIVDNNLNFCPPGVSGELLISGAGLSIGYLNKPELTAEKFIVNPFDKEKKTKVYRTGDLVKLNSKMQIEFLGRIDSQVKIRGFRIELDEIESVIKQSELVKDCAVVVKEINNDKKLVGYVIPDNSLLSKPKFNEKLIGKWLDEWELLYKEAKVKAHSKNDDDIDRNVTSLLTHDQILLTDAYNEWLFQTINRIKELKTRRILEIGTGGGQLLKEVAKDCEYFAATDFSKSSIEEFEKYLLKNKDQFPNYNLYTLPAEEKIPEEFNSFDTVIINSVIQYFPDMDYLMKVIENALNYLADGGTLFIGDVQSFSLLYNFHLNDQLLHIRDEETVAEFKSIVNKRVSIEPELVIDPIFFYELMNRSEKISNVVVKLREGKNSNETTLYHYDVFIVKRKELTDVTKFSEFDFSYELLDKLEDFKNDILNGKSDIVKVKNIPNKRLAKNLQMEKIIESSDSTDKIKNVVAGAELNFPEVSIEEVILNSKLDGIKLEFIVPPDSDLSKFDLVMLNEKLNIYEVNLYRGKNFERINHKSYNAPKTRFINELLLSEIRQITFNNLPDYMVPNFIIPIDKFPLTPNNKIDKKALAELKISDVNYSASTAKPENETQKLLIKIWENLLGISGIGIDDNFFELGGHSILAAQMLADFEKETGKRIPLAEMFTSQTIRQLSAKVENGNIKLNWNPLVEIKKGDENKIPLFLIHGAEGNVLLYRDLASRMNSNRTIYGLQAKGLDGKNSFNLSIEEMADEYILAIKSVQPSGPYNIGGYCMGGSVAYEIAMRLTAGGEKVANVFLLETYNACTLDYNQIKKTRVKEKIENIKFHLDNVKSLSGKEKIPFIKRKAETAIKRFGARINKLTSYIGISSSDKSIGHFSLTLRDINDKAQMEYSPLKYSGKVVLLRPKVSFATEPDPKFGWGDFVSGEFKVYNLDVAPRGMLTEPFVKQTSEIIEKELRF